MKTIAFIEAFTNLMGETRYRFYAVRKDGSRDRSLRVWKTKALCREHARRMGYHTQDR